MRKSLALLASAALIGLTLAAHASVDTTYNLINGTLINNQNSPAGTVTGTLTINTSTFAVDFANLTGTDQNGISLTGFTKPEYGYYNSYSNYFDIEIAKPGTSYDIYLYVATPANASGNLALCTVHNESCGGGNDSYFFPLGPDLYFTAGTLTPQVATAATPEPSSLLLLGTGLLGGAGAARRRFLNR